RQVISVESSCLRVSECLYDLLSWVRTGDQIVEFIFAYSNSDFFDFSVQQFLRNHLIPSLWNSEIFERRSFYSSHLLLVVYGSLFYHGIEFIVVNASAINVTYLIL